MPAPMPDNMKDFSQNPYYPNMDLVRYVLAIGVVVTHYNFLAGHSLPFFLSPFHCVGAFFALSGFLIYPTYHKSGSFKIFLRNRMRRILPPYLFIIFLAALGLVFVSSLSASSYFSSSEFWKYLIFNSLFLNWLQPSLPGVFEGPQFAISAVNPSLWTLKIEWCLYLSVPIVLTVMRRFRFNETRFLIAIILLSIIFRLAMMMLCMNSGNLIYYTLSQQFFGQVSYFYSGALIYIYRSLFIRHLGKFILAGCILTIISTQLKPYGEILLTPVALSCATLGFSLIPKSLNLLRHKNNVSYQIYLYHAPLIQLSVFLGWNTAPALISFPLVILLTLALSIIQHRIHLRFNISHLNIWRRLSEK
ncbi:MAG: acyltransferase [Bacteroides sp.]|nr:acyltransferase [Bacteroides sp.]